MVLGKRDSHIQKKETGPLAHTYTQMNWKWIKASNVIPETVKRLEENIGNKLLHTGLGVDLAYVFHSKSKGNQSKIKHMEQHQTEKPGRTLKHYL